MKINKLLLPVMAVTLMLPVIGSTKTNYIYKKTIIKKEASRGAKDFLYHTKFDISGLDYLTDYQESQVSVGGTSNTFKVYHTFDLWTAVYKEYDNENDDMYYYVFAFPEINTNQNDAGVFRIVTKYIRVSFEAKAESGAYTYANNCLSLLSWAPEQLGNTATTISAGLSLSGGAEGKSPTLSGEVAIGTDTCNSNVRLTTITSSATFSEDDKIFYASYDNDKFVRFSFDLYNKYNSYATGSAPYKGYLKEPAVAIYKANNYASLRCSATRLYFKINAEGSSQKFNKAIWSGCESKSTYQQREYCIGL